MEDTRRGGAGVVARPSPRDAGTNKMQFGTLERVSAPIHEPVSLGEMRAHLRVDHHFDDAQISAALKGARAHAENVTRRAIIRQQWRAEITGEWKTGGATLDLPRPRLIELVALEYRNSAGDWISAPATAYRARLSTEPAQIWLREPPGDLGSLDHEEDGLWRAIYWAGYGPLPNDVPEDLRVAVRMLAAHYYEVRQPTVEGHIVIQVPRGIDDLLAPYRVPWGGPNL
jgi:uncharacterized phiE125 gp8 family phage protein